MVALPWDSAWVDKTFRSGLLDLNGWSPMGAGHPLTQGHRKRFSPVMPASVMQIWERFGFDGFGQGRFWITGPLAWQPIVDAWLEDLELPFPEQDWWCLTRTALGYMHLWGEVSGPALTITPMMGWVRPNSARAGRMADPVMRERMGCTVFTVPFPDKLEDDDTGQDAVSSGLGRFGPLGEGQVLGLTPPCCLTGRVRLEDVGLHEAEPYLVTLAQVQPRVLAQDFSAQAGQVAAVIAARHAGTAGGTSTRPGSEG